MFLKVLHGWVQSFFIGIEKILILHQKKSLHFCQFAVTKDTVCVVFLIFSIQKRKTASYAVKEDSASAACLQCVFLICSAREQPGFIDKYEFRICCKTKKWSSLNSLFLLLIYNQLQNILFWFFLILASDFTLFLSMS